MVIMHFPNFTFNALKTQRTKGLNIKTKCLAYNIILRLFSRLYVQGVRFIVKILKQFYRTAIPMMNLDDLLIPEEQSQLHSFQSSSLKPSYFPQLKEVQDQDQEPTALDPFFDHPNHHPLSSTFSQLQQPEQANLEPLQALNPSSNRGRGRAKMINKSRNQTKNIPKNFGKGIISFIEQNKTKLAQVIKSQGFDYQIFVGDLRILKKEINTIAELRQLWTGEKGQCLRIISNLFFRKYALEYIFNSRISSYGSHIKYRGSLWQALKQPETFNHIKQF